MPKEDQNTIHNWREILRDFLWRRVRDSRNFHRPSRRWDGTGVMLPGRSSRDFPKTALILDFSGSMREYLETCAETVTALIAEVSSGDVLVIGCNDKVVYRNLVRRNSKPPKSSEILRHYRGGGTHMMPAIKEAREWGAEIILCVSDMNTRSEDLRCPDVHWITSRTDPMVGTWGYEEKTPVAGKTFRVLRVKTRVSPYEMDVLRKQGIHIKTDEELEKQPAVSWEKNRNNKKQTTRRTNRKETRP
jgi:predicted metal-dependent peptidase